MQTLLSTRSNAFTGPVQGMVQNYTDFVSELTPSADAMMSQRQATFPQQTHLATANVIDTADGRTCRHRQTAQAARHPGAEALRRPFSTLSGNP